MDWNELMLQITAILTSLFALIWAFIQTQF